jgi:hypothetical protein
MTSRQIALATIICCMLTAIASAVPAAAAGQSCSQLNDRVFGSDGQGGQAAQFRALKAKTDAERGAGQTAAAAKDSAANLKLATSILASARIMQTAHCKSRVVVQPSAATPSTPSGAWMVTIAVKLPSGAPAKGATVRMYTVASDYSIVVLQTKSADSSGIVAFKVPRPGLSFKGEFGNDANGRPTNVGGLRVRDHQTRATLTLN